jgi:geranylgeranyl diphosphate synthase type II
MRIPVDMDLKSYLSLKRAVIDHALGLFLPNTAEPSADVVRAMQYSLFAGGKRLRPILCIAGAEAVGGEERRVIPIACALEMIHTYSLIHDDLPAMDNDDMRRGKPTSHRMFGEALALLAGDGLLSEAFRLMADPECLGDGDPRACLRVIHMIAVAAGYRGMLGGQTVDILSEGKTADPSTVNFIHTHKTGALISVSVAAGAVLGGGSSEQVEALSIFGSKIGLAFQIADDILDIEGESEHTGKGVGGDARKGKMTYPAAFGVDGSRSVQYGLVEEALASVDAFDHRADPLRSIAGYIIERRR